MNEKEGERYVPYEWRLSLQSPGWASILSSLIGLTEKTKIQWNFYSNEISSIIYPSTIEKLIWNKYKFERNRTSMNLYWWEQSVTYNHGCSATASPSSLCLDPCSNNPHRMLMLQWYLPYEIISLILHKCLHSLWDHKLGASQFLYPPSSMESPHYIGFGGLTTMEMISHQIH